MGAHAPRSAAPASRRIPAVQGLRAVAVLLVVAYHTHLPLGAGFQGVDVFFVISGFVITRMLVGKIAAEGSVRLGWFWAGRVRRLLPALTVMVAVTLLLATPLSSPVRLQDNLALSGIGAVTWVANVVLVVVTWGYFLPGADLNPFLHTWSLAVEEQFYLCFPLLVVFAFWAARKRGRPGWGLLTGLVVGATLLSFAISLALTYATPITLPLAFYSPVSRAWEFGVGALVALALRRRTAPQGATATALGLLGGGLIVAGLVLSHDVTSFPGFLVLFPVVGTGLLVLVADTGSKVASALSTRWLVYIGDRSYGWYLYHWPLLVLGRDFWRPGQSPVWIDAAAVVGSFGLAVLSYRYLEEPIRHGRRLGGWTAPRLAGGLIAVPVAMCVLLMLAVDQGWWNRNVQDFQAGTSHRYWKYQATCQDPGPVSDRDIEQCRFVGDPSRPGFILLGDSNAGVYADVLVRAGQELDRTVTVATIPTCELSDQRAGFSGYRLTFLIDCRARYDDTMAWLAKQAPSVVLLASGSNVVDADDQVVYDRDGKVYRTREAKIRSERDDLVKTYQRIEQMGHRAVPITQVPSFRDSEDYAWMPATCALVTVLDDPQRCGRSITRAEADARQAGTLQAQADAVRIAGVQSLGFRDEICRDDVCTTNRGDFWVYEDGAHLSYREAMSLLPSFLEDLPRLRGPVS